MKIRTLNEVAVAENATVEMNSGDRLSVGFKDKAGEFQVITLMVQGGVCVVSHEQTQDALVVRRDRAQYVKG